MNNIVKGSITYCSGCGLPVINCICTSIHPRTTSVEFWILSHERELKRPSNTGKLIKVLFGQQVQIVTWQRNQEPKALIDRMKDDDYQVFLVFPSEKAEPKRSVSIERKDAAKKTAFILLDGTWQEARKMMRKSPYLEKIPIVSLDPEQKTKFVLRRGISDQHLCTFETAMELLKLTDENENAAFMESFFDDYLTRFQAGRCGQQIETSNP